MINRRVFLRGGALAAVGVVFASCSSGGNGGRLSGTAVGGQDINPKPREEVRDGGDLRWPIDGLPNNYNYNQVDGTTAETIAIINALIPAPFLATADGGSRVNPDYLTSAAVTSTNPQVVTYTINPKAAWSDGIPITWRDFEASWKSQNGANPGYQAAGTSGYEDVSSVARGTDDKQVVVTFKKTFAEWRALFGPLYPASHTSTPKAFNSDWATAMPVTAGPFMLDSIDQTAKTVTVKRDPRWWGTPAKLDRIIFRALDRAALPDALANDEIDFYDVGADVNLLRRAQSTPGVVIRDAPSPYYEQVTLNGAPGAVLADPAVRKAVAQGIDRNAVAQRMIGQVEPNSGTTGNHIYRKGSKQYRDNGAELTFDPAAAERTLDALGWTRPSPGATRHKNGKPLSLRLIYYTAGANEDLVRTLQNQLDQIGVAVVGQQYPSQEWTTNLTSGNFDLVIFAWGSTPTPLSSSASIFTTPPPGNVRQNYGRISSSEIDRLFAQSIAELDEAKRIDIGNQIDKLLWANQHDIPLYARPGAYAVRSTLANFGAPGFADIDYINAGFIK
ncbi:MAG: ABC transporter family substrate-binding protein [Pseudonocardia sp.]|nr:ABC transporter family substrate-binding protein [Pseudonocardia sp.]